MYEVLLVRHGASQANAGEPTKDPQDVELIPRGHIEAKQTANFLEAYRPPALIITSSYLRAKQTAAYTKALFPSVLVEEWPVYEFAYLTSMHREQLTANQRKPLVDTYWEELLPDYEDEPGSESFRSFTHRVRKFMEKLNDPAYESYENAVVFSHERFITALRWLIDERPLEISRETMRDYRTYFNHYRIPNGGIIHLKIGQNRISHELLEEHLKRSIWERLEWENLQKKQVALRT